MVDRVGLSAWRQRRRRQRHGTSNSSSSSARVPPCLVHIIERSSPFSGADDAEAAGEEGVQVVRCPKSGVNFFDLGDFERQFEGAKQRTGSSLEAYLGSLSSSAHQQLPQQQAAVAADSRSQAMWDSQQQRSSVVLPSARRSAAAAAAVASSSPGSGSTTRRVATPGGSPSKPSPSG
jgi:hypothetical protein